MLDDYICTITCEEYYRNDDDNDEEEDEELYGTR